MSAISISIDGVAVPYRDVKIDYHPDGTSTATVTLLGGGLSTLYGKLVVDSGGSRWVGIVSSISTSHWGEQRVLVKGKFATGGTFFTASAVSMAFGVIPQYKFGDVIRARDADPGRPRFMVIRDGGERSMDLVILDDGPADVYHNQHIVRSEWELAE